MVGDEVRVWHPEQLLVVEPCQLRRRGQAVRDDVVDEIGAHCAGKSHVQELQRRGTEGEDLIARALGVAVEVDKHVDSVGGDEVGDGGRVEMRDLRIRGPRGV